MAEIDQIIDDFGMVRRLGSLAPDAGLLQLSDDMLTAAEEWDDAKILRVLKAIGWKPSREMFGDAWICDQLSFGSCNGWATAELIIRTMFLRGIRSALTKLSGSYLYAWMNGNRDQGSNLTEGLKVAELHGAPPAAMVPANRIYRSQMPAGADDEAAKHKGFKCYFVRTIQALKTALAKGHPCVVAVHAGSNFQRLNSQGIAGVDNGRGNHAVCVDGLDIVGGKIVFDMANSWGLRYGTSGRAYLTEDHFEQTMGTHGFWAMGSTQEAE